MNAINILLRKLADIIHNTQTRVRDLIYIKNRQILRNLRYALNKGISVNVNSFMCVFNQKILTFHIPKQTLFR